MIKLKKLLLKNYCGYKDLELDFVDSEGDVKRWAVFYGPNGIGKSNFVGAVELLTNPGYISGRSNPQFFRRLKYHKNYIAQMSMMQDGVSDLRMEGIFVDENNQEKRIVIEDTFKGMLGKNLWLETLSKRERELVEWDRENAVSSITLNELPSSAISHSICIDADHPNNMNKFQIYRELKEPFLDFAEAIYGFKCFIPDDSIQVDMGIEYFTNFILDKPDGTRVHYKSFSDGEKKIATLLSTLFKKGYKSSVNKDPKNIIMVDNIEMHIYWKRHMTLIQKVEEFFPDKQVLATTHSPIIVREMNSKYLYDLEEYVEMLRESDC